VSALDISPNRIATASIASSVVFALLPMSGAGSVPADRLPEDMPASIPSDQAYYWSANWQTDIRESLAALKAGEYVEFDSDDPNDIVRWFLSGD
jgi:hypothetical protein